MYLRDTDKIIEVKNVPVKSYFVTGYGKKIPTVRMIRTEKGGNRWNRVYCMIYSNAGSCYIIRKGERLFVDDRDFPS